MKQPTAGQKGKAGRAAAAGHGAASPEAAMAKCLRDWSWPESASQEGEAMQLATGALSEVVGFAKGSALPAWRKLGFERLMLEYARGRTMGRAGGCIHLDFGPSMQMARFEAAAEAGVDAAAEAGMALMMEAHPLLGRGWGPGGQAAGPSPALRNVAPEDLAEVGRWVGACTGQGGVCALFAKRLAERAAMLPVRESAAAELRARLGLCAASGLIPSAYQDAALMLAGGLGSGPAWIERLSLPAPDGKGRVDLMRPSSVIRRDQRDPWEWSLPPASEGIEAMWEKLAGLVAKDLARGWSYEEFGPARDAPQKARVALERWQIGEASAAGAAPARRSSI